MHESGPQLSCLPMEASCPRYTSVSSLIASNYLRRAATLRVPPRPTQLHAEVAQETLARGFFLDPFACELERYVTGDLERAAWSVVDSQDAIEIAILEGSRYAADAYVYRVVMELSPVVKASFLMAMMENPEFRTQWDVTTREMTVVYIAEENAYLRCFTQRWDPGAEDREHLDKCQIKQLREELRLVYYSVDDLVHLTQDFPRKVRIPRAHTFFGVVQIAESADKLTLRMTEQRQTPQDLETDLANWYDWSAHLRETVETRAY